MIITIAHQKGGVGKSTLAVNLAVEMELPVIDLDSQNSCYLFSRIRERNHNKLLRIYTPENLSELKKILNTEKDKNFLIDSGGYDNDLNRYALVVSDIVITPVSPSQIEVFGLEKFLKIIKKAKQYNPELKVYVLINNADSRSLSEIRDLEKFIEGEEIFQLLNSKLFRRVDFKRAYQNGLSVCEYKPDSKACRELRALIMEIKLHM